MAAAIVLLAINLLCPVLSATNTAASMQQSTSMRAQVEGDAAVVEKEVTIGVTLRWSAPAVFESNPAQDADSKPQEGNRAVCINSQISPQGQTKQSVAFTDVTNMAGVRGSAPQAIVRTSPNCMFDQYDRARKAWDSGTFCMPEILTGGAATGDFDGDGWPDLYVTRLDAADSLFRNNNGDGTFTDASEESNIAALTSSVRSNGVAFIDIDNDGDQDIFVSTVGDVRMYLFVNDGYGGFTEEALVRGADLSRPASSPPGEGGLTSSFSIAVGDYDGDGWLDLYTTEWFPRLHVPDNLLKNESGVHHSVTCKLLRNLGSLGRPGHFADSSWSAGIRPRVGGAEMEADQMNSKKWFSKEHQAEMLERLLRLGLDRNEAKLRIEGVNAEAKGMFDKQEARNVVMQDMFSKIGKGTRSIDGKHIPFHYMEGFPYLGTFQFGSRLVDLDGDGHQDLLVSGDFGTSQLYWNNGNGTFSTGPIHLLWDYFDNGMGSSIGDINNDGKLDVLFTSMALKAPSRIAVDRFYPKAGIASNFEGNHLYLNDGKRMFTDITAQAGVKDTGWSWGGILFDYDNDGWLDLAISNGMDDPETTDDDFAVNTPNAAFRNTGPGGQFAFAPVAPQLGLDDRRDGRGYFEFDYDGDGDLDLFLVNHADYPVLYRNDGGNQHAWLRIRAVEASCDASTSSASTAGVVSPSCNPRDSIGARVYLQRADGEPEIVREIGSAAAYMAHSQLTAHFGLGLLGADDDVEAGRISTVKRVRIVWPSKNATSILYDVPVRSDITVRAPAERDAAVTTQLATTQQQPASSSTTHPTVAAAVPECASISPTISSASVTSGHADVTVHPSGRWLSVKATDKSRVGEVVTVRYLLTHAGVTSRQTLNVRFRAPAQSSSASPLPSTEASSRTRVATGISALVSEWHIELEVPTSSDAAYHSGEVFSFEDHTVKKRVLGKRGPNNLDRPDWGTAGTPLLRIAPASYDVPNGDRMPGTKRFKGPLSLLPSARLISNKIMSSSSLGMQKAPQSTSVISNRTGARSSDAQYIPAHSQLLAYFAAFLHHDMVSTFPMQHLRKASSGKESVDNIAVPKGDSQWDPSSRGNKQIPFMRAPYFTTTATDGQQHRHQVNYVTSYLDLHQVYGTDPVRAGRLVHARTPPGAGLFIMTKPAELAGRDVTVSQGMLPLNDRKDPIPTINPYSVSHEMLHACGDDRCNMHPGLLLFHTLFMREHSQVYLFVQSLPPFAEGHLRTTTGSYPGAKPTANTTVYAVAASIVRAEYQAIVWYEFLPAMLGPHVYATMPRYTGYKPSVNPSTSTEFAAVLGFVWHSMLPSTVPRSDESGKKHKKGHISLSDAWFAPQRVLQEGGYDPVLRGAWEHPIDEADILFPDEMRNGFLAAKAQGLDLPAIDIQRGRDHGLPTYNSMRASLGLPRLTSFSQLFNNSNLPANVQAKLIERLKQLYGPAAAALANATNFTTDNELFSSSTDAAGTQTLPSPSTQADWPDREQLPSNEAATPECFIFDVMDLLVGGALETHLPGAAVGPTFAAILREQFIRTRDGDRFWFENVLSALPLGDPRRTNSSSSSITTTAAADASVAEPLTALIGRFFKPADIRKSLEDLLQQNSGVKFEQKVLDGVRMPGAAANAQSASSASTLEAADPLDRMWADGLETLFTQSESPFYVRKSAGHPGGSASSKSKTSKTRRDR